MSMLSKNGRWLTAVLFLLTVLTFLAPFAAHLPETDDPATLVSGFSLLSGDDSVQVGGEPLSASSFQEMDGTGRTEDVHFYALILLTAMLGLMAALFDRSAKKRCVTTALFALLGTGLTGWMAWRLAQPFRAETEGGLFTVSGHAAWGLWLCLGAQLIALLLSVLSFMVCRKETLKEAASPSGKLSSISRVAVLGAISAVLYYFEVPIIPPIYKLDLSAVPALVAGFAMGPVQALGVMLVKDLIGLLHTSSMGVGELADFLMSGSMAALASAIYLRRHTFKGAVLSLAAGTLAITAVGALANYFIMIPFYVQVMHMPMDTIVSLIARTVPAVDSLPKLILLAVVPFNLLKGVVLSLVTLALYKRISPLLKTL